jgi:hypothetical protein
VPKLGENVPNLGENVPNLGEICMPNLCSKVDGSVALWCFGAVSCDAVIPPFYFFIPHTSSLLPTSFLRYCICMLVQCSVVCVVFPLEFSFMACH